MNKSTKFVVLTLSVVLLLLVVAGGLGVSASNQEGAYRQMGVFSEVLLRIRTEYVEEPNFRVVTNGALRGLVESLDSNSSYLSPEEYKEYRTRKQDGKADLGITLAKRFGYAAVISVLPNSPAAKAGMESGDIIEALESRSTREMSLAEILAKLPGEPGSRITFSVVRARRAEPLRVEVIRDVVQVPAIAERMMENNIGYLKVEALTPGKAKELADRIKNLQNQGAQKLILDLRNSAAGEISEGIAVANLFLNNGTITYLQGQRHPRENFTADAQSTVTNLPLVVLVNRSTAGPAEIAAAAILENARGDLVGDKTFGIAAMQKLIEVPDGGAVILSTAKYYTPSGKAIQDNPLTPNILVATASEELLVEDDQGNPISSPEPQPGREDEQLRRAVEVLKARA